jgi:hypothetical protein
VLAYAADHATITEGARPFRVTISDEEPTSADQ